MFVCDPTALPSAGNATHERVRASNAIPGVERPEDGERLIPFGHSGRHTFISVTNSCLAYVS